MRHRRSQARRKNEMEGGNMKLSEYLATCDSSTEVTVWDDVYDMEMYFYNAPVDDDFDKAVSLIAQCVNIVEISENGVTVDFWGAIEQSRQALIDNGFYPEGSSTEYLMHDVDLILAGNLSEKTTLEWAQIIYNSVMKTKE